MYDLKLSIVCDSLSVNFKALKRINIENNFPCLNQIFHNTIKNYINGLKKFFPMVEHIIRSKID